MKELYDQELVEAKQCDSFLNGAFWYSFELLIKSEFALRLEMFASLILFSLPISSEGKRGMEVIVGLLYLP